MIHLSTFQKYLIGIEAMNRMHCDHRCEISTSALSNKMNNLFPGLELNKLINTCFIDRRMGELMSSQDLKRIASKIIEEFHGNLSSMLLNKTKLQ